MSETTLKRIPTEKEVNRLRNLIQGKYGDKDTISIGYNKKEITHKEGDTWEENNKTWIIKDGIKQNITRLDDAKQIPLFCPECKKIMKLKYDKGFYLQYNRCTNCQIEFETELKRTGLWEEWEKNIINTDIDNLIEDFEIWFDENLKDENQSFIYENGDIENWVGSIKLKLLKDKKEAIKFLQKLKK